MNNSTWRRKCAVAIAGSAIVLSGLAAVSLTQASPAAADSTTFVQPFNPAIFTAGMPTDAASVRARTILTNANKFAVNKWWNTVMNFDAQTGYLTFGGTAEPNIRGNASEAYSLAVSLATGAYDATATGVSAADARAIAVRLASSLAYRHKVNLAGGWGDAWQSASWAAFAGTAGWLLWADLTPTDREYVRKMVEYEANRFIGYRTPYWKNADGTAQRPCEDTAAEENAWNTRILTLATTMLPQHPSRAGWAYKRYELAVSSYAKPSDTTNNTLVRGRPVRDWVEGSNATEFGAVVNHGFYHPDYATTITEQLAGALVAPLAGLPMGRDTLAGADVVYQGLVDYQWVGNFQKPCASSSRNFVAPGASNPTGTSYVDSSSEIYFPQGNDWGNYRRLHYATMDALISEFGADNLVSEKAADWEDLHADDALSMQQRPLADGSASDGSTYRSAGEDTYSRREEAVALQAGQLWLVHWLKHQGRISFTDTNSSIIVDNRDRGFTSGGTWGTGMLSAANPNVFGVDCRFASAGSGAWARFQPRLSQARTFQVWARWEDAANYSAAANFTVHHANGDTTVAKDQRSGAGSWQLLGTFTLDTNSYVQLASSADGYVIADAVQFTPVG